MMPSTSAFTFPPEIIDMITDHLHASPRTLLSLSLHPSFLPSARYHLFSSLAVPLHTRGLFGLLSLLDSPHGTIKPYIQRLLFTDLTKMVATHGLGDVIRAIRNLPRLPKVKAVKLANTDFEKVPGEVLGLLMYHLRHFALTFLAVERLHFSRFSEVAGLFNVFSGSAGVEARQVSWTYGAGGYAPQPPPNVEWEIADISGGDMLQWLADSGATVRRLEGEAGVIRDLIRSVGPSIRQLQVSLSDHSLIDVSPCTFLRSLHLHLPPTPSDGHLITDILTTVQSRHLQELVVIGISLPIVMDWDELDQVLAYHRSLRRICFVLSRGMAQLEMGKHITDVLPTCRNIIQIVPSKMRT
ncbi:uncharacterized protein BT62DRAFT_489893 [Guyanagaster necrorhizus]|uniref:Uncharacterized protein n=1 Tax=Guyanagaster necrorhizus TaxID=856835 RepID=A0A9P7VJV0_9AGAR|nr:uncharacterized protein BT62DRAFT_489893 [Guyanagaster necrorhizus MCA 3950]KAG7441326.1 hypothetical protein BT62DRAFT_489893 [Guyanagaster necrorhizus MCA 3950]